MDDPHDIGQEVRAAARRLASRLTVADRQVANRPADESFAEVTVTLDEFLAVCRATGLWGPANQLLSAKAWSIAGDLLSRGWLMQRARGKPRGYAGDYELLGRMFHGQLCDDPLGRLLDRYFQQDAAPVAVRNRMAMMRDWIVEAARGLPVKIAVVGLAFGLEVRAALQLLDADERASVSVTLLDIDPAAIEFARAQLTPLLRPEQLATASVNLFRLPQRPQLAESLTEIDLVRCPGIFDYLDDVAAVQMLRFFWQRLAPGGRMAVFQFAPHNPSRALMEWIGNWHLIYRDAVQLRAVATAAGIPPAAATFGAEAQGVDLFVTAVRA